MSETCPRACGKCRHFIPMDRDRWARDGAVVGLCDHPLGLLPTPYQVTKHYLGGGRFPQSGINPGYFGADSYCRNYARRPWWRAREYAAAVAAITA